jgi:hypothetical protein
MTSYSDPVLVKTDRSICFHLDLAVRQYSIAVTVARMLRKLFYPCSLSTGTELVLTGCSSLYTPQWESGGQCVSMLPFNQTLQTPLWNNGCSVVNINVGLPMNDVIGRYSAQ